MALTPELKTFLRTDPIGQAARQNAWGGCFLALHDVAGALQTLLDVDADLAARPTTDRTSAVIAALNRIRFGAGGVTGVVRGRLGLPLENAIDLTGESLCCVAPVGMLGAIADGTLTRAIDWPTRETALTEGVIRALLTRPKREITISDRRDKDGLPTALGRPIVWFTTSAAVDDLRQGFVPPPDPPGMTEWEARLWKMSQWANRLRDALGLIHLTPPTWLISLTFPGAAAHASTHYRPIFADCKGNPRFMVSSSVSNVIGAAWGQTADLRKLHARAANHDGLPERVARRVEKHHLGGLAVKFELLGQLTTEPGMPTPAMGPIAGYGGHARSEEIEAAFMAALRRTSSAAVQGAHP